MKKSFIFSSIILIFIVIFSCYAIAELSSEQNSFIKTVFRKTNPNKMDDNNSVSDSTNEGSSSISELQKQMEILHLRETFVKDIYCDLHNPKKPAGDYSEQRHFYWDKSKQKMVEIPGIYYVSPDAHEVKDMLDNYHKTGKMINDNISY